MQFSNPADSAQAAASTYTRNLLALLGDQDPYEVQDQLLPWLQGTLAEAPAPALAVPEAPDKWSILQVLGHLVDTEVVYGYRVRMIVAQDRPALAGYDQDLWARKLRYDQTDPREAMEELRVLRRRNIRLLRSLSAEEMKREGIHSERGPESVAHIHLLLAAHDLVHRRQITRIRGKLAG